MKRMLTAALISVLMISSLSGCDGHAYVEGRFLRSNSGDPMIIIYGTEPCTIAADDAEMFSDFTNGDLIKLEYDGSIAESYPAQIHTIYGAELLEDGEISDIDQSVLDSLIEMGWISE